MSTFRLRRLAEREFALYECAETAFELSAVWLICSNERERELSARARGWR